ncbi:MAG: OmpH family outer membrane protein [Terracidiphilus sp.]|jgi:outer membrane protein
MKRQIALFLTLASGLALSAAAQTPQAAATAGPTKVAIIAFQAAVGQTNEFQRNFTDLQKKYEPKRQQLKTLSDEIDSLTKQLQAQGDKLTEGERASRAKAIEDKKKQAKRIGEDAQNDYQQEVQQVFGGVASKVGEVMVAYAQQNGYTLVLDGSENQQQAPLVLFANPATDITKAVIEAYNVKSGVPAPPAQPAAAAPKPASR